MYWPRAFPLQVLTLAFPLQVLATIRRGRSNYMYWPQAFPLQVLTLAFPLQVLTTPTPAFQRVLHGRVQALQVSRRYRNGTGIARKRGSHISVHSHVYRHLSQRPWSSNLHVLTTLFGRVRSTRPRRACTDLAASDFPLQVLHPSSQALHLAPVSLSRDTGFIERFLTRWTRALDPVCGLNDHNLT